MPTRPAWVELIRRTGSLLPAVWLTNVDLRLQVAEVPSDLSKVVYQLQGVRVILAQ
jgi:hypothetical protein